MPTRTTSAAALLFAICACAKASESSLVIAAPTPVSTTAPVDESAAQAARALAALDAGNIAEAERVIRAMLQATPNAPAAKGLAAAIDSFNGRGEARSFLLANAKLTRVAKLPAPSARRANPGTLVAKRTRGAAGSATSLYWAAGGAIYTSGLGDPQPSDSMPKFVPAKIAGQHLRRARATDGKWLAVYHDGLHVAVVGADGELVALLDFSAWKDPANHAEDQGVEWGELSGSTLYVRTQSSGQRHIVAVDVPSGAVSWRSEAAGFVDTFALTADAILAWHYGDGRVGELIAINRKTGATTARLKTPEVGIPGNPAVTQVKGHVALMTASSDSIPAHLQGDDYLEVALQAIPPAPTREAPALKTAEQLRAAPGPRDTSDARARAWRALDRTGDPRAALLAMRAYANAYPTNFAGEALLAIAEATLADERKRAGDALAARKPVVVPADQPSGLISVARSRTHTLHVKAKRALPPSPTAIFAEMPKLTDEDRIAPAWVPDAIGFRRRNEEAGAGATSDLRVEVYSAPYDGSYVVVWKAGIVEAMLDYKGTDVRFADAVSGVVIATINGHQAGLGYFLEARDAKTGAAAWRTPGMHDQYFLIEDGYVLASTAEAPSADVVLVDATNGAIVGHAGMPAPQDAFLMVRKDRALLGVSMRTVVELTLD